MYWQVHSNILKCLSWYTLTSDNSKNVYAIDLPAVVEGTGVVVCISIVVDPS